MSMIATAPAKKNGKSKKAPMKQGPVAMTFVVSGQVVTLPMDELRYTGDGRVLAPSPRQW